MKVQPRHAQANILLAATLFASPPYTRAGNASGFRSSRIAHHAHAGRHQLGVLSACGAARRKLRGDRRQLGGSE